MKVTLPIKVSAHARTAQGGTDRLVVLSLFARHDLPHVESSRLFGELSLLVSKQPTNALCALAARGGVVEEQDGAFSGNAGLASCIRACVGW